MKWFPEWSAARKRAWIVDEDGFVVVGPHIDSRDVARALCREHNRIVDMLAQRAVNDADPYGIHEERRRHP